MTTSGGCTPISRRGSSPSGQRTAGQHQAAARQPVPDEDDEMKYDDMDEIKDCFLVVY